MRNSSHPLPADPTFAAPAAPRPRRGCLLALALVAISGCAGVQVGAVSRRPTVILAHQPGACRPAALVDIDNPGHCPVQLVARGLDREYLGASAWIPAGQRHARFELPDRFAWIVLEVDPLCATTVGRIHYRPSAPICAPSPADAADAARARATLRRGPA